MMHIWGSLCLWDEDRLILLRTNDCPGLVTVAACCSRPIRDRSSCFVHHLQLFPAVGRAYLPGDAVSTSIPSTVRVVTGPSEFTGSIGIPSSWEAFKAEDIDDAHCVECGSPAMMKSST